MKFFQGTVKSPLTRIAVIMFFLTVLSGCGKVKEAPFNSNGVSTEAIKQILQDKYLSQFNIPEEFPRKIPESNSNATVNHQEVVSTGSSKPKAFVDAWRKKVAGSWLDVKDSDLDKVCVLFYGGLSDPSSTLAEYFKDSINQFKDGGIDIYSINAIRMVEDNRKTIEYPTETNSTSLFVCQADIVFKRQNGAFTSVQNSSLSWNYYLKGNDTTFGFTFKSYKK